MTVVVFLARGGICAGDTVRLCKKPGVKRCDYLDDRYIGVAINNACRGLRYSSRTDSGCCDKLFPMGLLALKIRKHITFCGVG